MRWASRWARRRPHCPRRRSDTWPASTRTTLPARTRVRLGSKIPPQVESGGSWVVGRGHRPCAAGARRGPTTRSPARRPAHRTPLRAHCRADGTRDIVGTSWTWRIESPPWAQGRSPTMRIADGLRRRSVCSRRRSTPKLQVRDDTLPARRSVVRESGPDPDRDGNPRGESTDAGFTRTPSARSTDRTTHGGSASTRRSRSRTRKSAHASAAPAWLLRGKASADGDRDSRLVPLCRCETPDGSRPCTGEPR